MQGQLLKIAGIILFFILSYWNAAVENRNLIKPEEEYVLNDEKLYYPDLVNKFYLLNGNRLRWFSRDSSDQSVKTALRKELIKSVDTSFYYHLIAGNYHNKELKTKVQLALQDSTELLSADMIFSDAAVAVFFDLYRGYKTKGWITFDAVAEKYREADNDYILSKLFAITSDLSLKTVISSLEPQNADYNILKDELKEQIKGKRNDSIRYLAIAMSNYRWIHHFGLKEFIMVNIPSCKLSYFRHDSLQLQMKVVVGKISTPTPLFAAWCDQVILYPYWYVPSSIVFKEYLPVIKRNPSWLEAHNMQVVDGAGNIINHHKLNWQSFHTGYFPYIIRQSTGCDNALGVIKFNINTPYGVYLHDTNNKTGFLSASRYYSHGCIRIQEPVQLASQIMREELDTTYLKACFKDQIPVVKLLPVAIPVFSVYIPAEAKSDGIVVYYRDIYNLLK